MKLIAGYALGVLLYYAIDWFVTRGYGYFVAAVAFDIIVIVAIAAQAIGEERNPGR